MTKKKTLHEHVPDIEPEINIKIEPVKEEEVKINKLLEVLITGSSRPQLFPFFYESFKKMCIIRDTPKITMHEDFVFPEQSKKLVRLVKSKYPEITLDTDIPPRGLGWTLEHYLFNRIQTKYILYLQEDWMFERPIDIDKLVWIMDKNQDINLIFFNKIRNNASINQQKQEMVDYEGYKFCCYHSWTMLPALWRVDFVKKHWPRGVRIKPESAFTQQFGTHNTRTPVDYCRKNIGAYIMGKTGEHRYVRHMGNDWRMAAWQLENASDHGGPSGTLVPGGNHNSKTMDLNYIAPWVPYPETPIQRGDLANE